MLGCTWRHIDWAVHQSCTTRFHFSCLYTGRDLLLCVVFTAVTPSACFANMKVKLPFTTEKLRFTINQLIEPIIGKQLVFHLYDYVQHRPWRGHTYARQRMKIVSDPVLNIHIDCVSNCDVPMNPSYRFVIKAVCKVCRSFSFTWVFVSENSSNSVIAIEKKDTLTGLRNAVLNVNPHVFESDNNETYSFQLNGKNY